MASARATANGAPAEPDNDPASPFRRRLLDAMAAAIAEHGYPSTTVAEVVRRAQTSRRTFYEYFADRDACYADLLIEHNTTLVNEIVAAVDGDAAWHDQIEQAVDTWIAVGERNPALVVSWIRDAPSLGANAHRLQVQFSHAFVEMLLRLCNTKKLRAAGIGPISRQRAVIVMGGLRELTAVTVENGDRIRSIRGEAVDAVSSLLGPGRTPPRKSTPRRSPAR
jgi:AcrR family transcriptional regulator